MSGKNKGNSGKKNNSQNSSSSNPKNKKKNKNKNKKMSVSLFPGLGNQQGVASAYSQKVRVTGPIIREGKGTTRIRNSELIVPSILNNPNFTVQATIELNPGLSASFPWLSTVANNYEQYRFNTLSFCYISSASTNTTGDIYIIPEYDADDPPPTTETQASTFQGTVSDRVWNNLSMVMDNSAMMSPGPRKFVRQGNVAGDIKTYDSGLLYAATVSGANTQAVGKLYVEYDVEFFVPQTGTFVPMSSQSSWFTITAGAQVLAAGPNLIAFDTIGADPLRIGIPTGVPLQFKLPVGVYVYYLTVTFQDGNPLDSEVDYSILPYSSGTPMAPPVSQASLNPSVFGSPTFANGALVGLFFSPPGGKLINFAVVVTTTGTYTGSSIPLYGASVIFQAA